MSALQMMIDEINAVTTAEAGAALVKRWITFPEAVAPDAATGPTGTRNCSLIAEFVARRFLNGNVNWGSVMGRKPDITLKSDTKALPFAKDGVVYLAGTGAIDHELCIIRDHDYTALLHAWSGKFEIFPRLNPGFTYNVHGPGSDGESRVLKALTSGEPIRGNGPVMPQEWAGITV